MPLFPHREHFSGGADGLTGRGTTAGQPERESIFETPKRMDYEELELGIGGLDSIEAEEKLASALRGLHGIHGVRLVRGGAHIIFNPLGITRDEICAEVRRAGFALDTIQKTGEL